MGASTISAWFSRFVMSLGNSRKALEIPYVPGELNQYFVRTPEIVKTCCLTKFISHPNHHLHNFHDCKIGVTETGAVMMILSLGENDTVLLQSVDAQRHDSYRVSLMIARTKWFAPLTHKTQIKKKNTQLIEDHHRPSRHSANPSCSPARSLFCLGETTPRKAECPNPPSSPDFFLIRQWVGSIVS